MRHQARGLLCTLATGCLLAHAIGAAAEGPAAESAVYPAPPASPRYRFERAIHGSKDLTEPPGGSALRRFLGKDDPSPGPGLSNPHAVAVEHGRVFVSDVDEGRVNVFDLRARRFYAIGERGAVTLQRPLGLSLGGGLLYVADGLANAVVVFDEQGGYRSSIGGPDWFSRLVGVAVAPGGTRLYALDAGAPDGNDPQVRVFDARDGSHLFDFGSRGFAPGEFEQPADLAVGRDGQVFVVDSGNCRVQVFDPEGRYLRSIGGPGKPPGGFGRPKAIAFDGAGNVAVVDPMFGGILVFEPNGTPAYAIGGNGVAGPLKTLLPVGIAIDGDDSLYLLDQGYHEIDVLRPFDAVRAGVPNK